MTRMNFHEFDKKRLYAFLKYYTADHADTKLPNIENIDSFTIVNEGHNPGENGFSIDLKTNNTDYTIYLGTNYDELKSSWLNTHDKLVGELLKQGVISLHNLKKVL